MATTPGHRPSHDAAYSLPLLAVLLILGSIIIRLLISLSLLLILGSAIIWLLSSLDRCIDDDSKANEQ